MASSVASWSRNCTWWPGDFHCVYSCWFSPGAREVVQGLWEEAAASGNAKAYTFLDIALNRCVLGVRLKNYQLCEKAACTFKNSQGSCNFELNSKCITLSLQFRQAPRKGFSFLWKVWKLLQTIYSTSATILSWSSSHSSMMENSSNCHCELLFTLHWPSLQETC